MYFFYLDESGTRDPQVSGTDAHGKIFVKDYIYVLLAIGLHESRWAAFDQEIADTKLALRARLLKQKSVELPSLADCEVKSTGLRLGKAAGQKGYNKFLHHLDAAERKMLADLFYSQIEKHHMRIFATIIDKRFLKPETTPEFMHNKAYELTLERIEHFMAEYHYKQRALVVMDDLQKQLNSAVAMKHARFQREGNANLKFAHIVEYPFFTDSKLSNGVQLADLCAYNVHRVFKTEDFTYPYFARTLPSFYRSLKSAGGKIDGLKIWPDASPLAAIAREKCWNPTQQKKDSPPTDGELDVGLGLPKHLSISSLQGSTQRKEP